MGNYNNLNEFQLSALSEIGNIGAGNAAAALADFMGDTIMMSVPELQIIDVNSMTTILGGPENEMVGILVTMNSDVRGMLLFLLEKDFVCLLLNVLLNKSINDFTDISEMDMSVIMEIGNVLAGSYVSAIATMTDLDIRLSTPQVAIDMVGAILNYPAAYFGVMDDNLLFIEENFLSEENIIRSHLLIMPEPDSLSLIFESLGMSS
ncbi:MAG: chemotaxis protein CheC [Syntrophomonadaceae bacterium]|nr:chemotaxis protein CheC [Syntrophomonadaceae bacterium]